MGKEDLRHRVARTSRDIVHNLQSGADLARQRTATHEGGHDFRRRYQLVVDQERALRETGIVGGFNRDTTPDPYARPLVDPRPLELRDQVETAGKLVEVRQRLEDAKVEGEYGVNGEHI